MSSGAHPPAVGETDGRAVCSSPVRDTPIRAASRPIIFNHSDPATGRTGKGYMDGFNLVCRINIYTWMRYSVPCIFWQNGSGTISYSMFWGRSSSGPGFSFLQVWHYIPLDSYPDCTSRPPGYGASAGSRRPVTSSLGGPFPGCVPPAAGVRMLNPYYGAPSTFDASASFMDVT